MGYKELEFAECNTSRLHIYSKLSTANELYTIIHKNVWYAEFLILI